MFITGLIIGGVIMAFVGYNRGFKKGAEKAFDESLKATKEMLRAKGII